MRTFTRTTALALAIAVAIGITTVGSATLQPSSASAATTKLATPTIRTVSGDNTVTVVWGKVAGASSYTIHYSTSSRFSSYKVVKTSSTHKRIPKLTNGKKYYLRVFATGSGHQNSSASATKHSTPSSAYPAKLVVTVVPAGINQVKVSWTGQSHATEVAVIGASEGSFSKNVFRTKWYAATTTSIILTVPDKRSLRERLGTGSGNPIFVKVAVYNSSSAGGSASLPVASTAASNRAGLRLSVVGPNANAGYVTPSASAERIRIAELNVNSVSASAGFSGYKWTDRRGKVAAEIKASKAAIVTTAELGTADAGTTGSNKQWQDLAALLKGSYSITAPVTPVGSAKNTTKAAHIFYQPWRVSLVKAGAISPTGTLNVSGYPSSVQRKVMDWAEFQSKSTGKRFFVVSVHLPSDKGSSYDALRVREVTALNVYMSKLAGGLPVIMSGDFNSSFAATSTNPASALVKAGYYDSSATKSRSNPRISTANITNQKDNKKIAGYPFTPYRYKYAAPRIDYIMVKGSVGSYAYVNQVILSGSKFAPAYHGSDHNLQYADIGLR